MNPACYNHPNRDAQQVVLNEGAPDEKHMCEECYEKWLEGALFNGEKG